ncbi:MAG: MoxR family ATPase [Candidatus Micrarchaeaceae archaeon]
MVDPKEIYEKAMSELKKKIAGKEDTLKLLLIALVANGHALLEGVPGVAKTTMTKTLANIMDGTFSRIQGTADLKEEDILGYSYFDEAERAVKVKKGPIFTNVLLIDELNRAPPKVMNAFLEALEERQVTIAGQDFKLPSPFIAFATQNPLRIEGTEPIPKVLADRFIMKIDVTYPSMEEEIEMLRIKEREEEIKTEKVLTTIDVIELQMMAKKVEMDNDVAQYIARLVDETRKDIHVVMGASPRADIAFMNCSKAKALLEGRKKVSMEDIRFLAKPVLSHRIVVRATGGLGVNGIIDGIVATVS